MIHGASRSHGQFREMRYVGIILALTVRRDEARPADVFNRFPIAARKPFPNVLVEDPVARAWAAVVPRQSIATQPN